MPISSFCLAPFSKFENPYSKKWPTCGVKMSLAPSYKWLMNAQRRKTVPASPMVLRDPSKVTSYVLQLERVHGVKIPAVIQASPDISFSYAVSVSFYHAKTKTFFGNTWKRSVWLILNHLLSN
jgi:hypothetical protein